MKYFSFPLIYILLCSSFIIAQKAPYLKQNPSFTGQQNIAQSGKPHPDYSPYFNDLLGQIHRDIGRLVNKGFIDGRIAIVEFKTHPYFYESERSYVLTGLELLKFNSKRGTYKGGIYVDKKETGFVRSLKALSLRAYQVADQIVLEKGLKSETQLQNFAKKINAKYYTKVHLNRTKNSFELSIVVQEVKSKQKIYQRKVVAATKLFAHYFSGNFSINLNTSHFETAGLNYVGKVGLGQIFAIGMVLGANYSFNTTTYQIPIGMEFGLNFVRLFTDNFIDKFNADLFMRIGGQFGFSAGNNLFLGAYFFSGGVRMALANKFFLSVLVQYFSNDQFIFLTGAGIHF